MNSLAGPGRTWLTGIGLLSGVFLGYFLRDVNPAGLHPPRATAQENGVNSSTAAPAVIATASVGSKAKKQTGYLLQSPGNTAEVTDYDFELGPNHISKLLPYPRPCREGDRTPFDLWNYGGRGSSSWGSPNLRMDWLEWVNHCNQLKPELMADVSQYMKTRFNFSGRVIPGVLMSGHRKPVMAGPTAVLPKGVDTWSSYAALSPSQIRDSDIFPYKPLAHPLQSTAHMVFPEMWLTAHPEHRRMDVDLDFPDEYLPEYPAPMYLTTHKELGDVTNGQEVTLGNYFEIFNGLLTAEQMEGLKELLRPSPTTWFNQTEHRVTMEPSAGVACFSCHVNGHTNAAIELAPDTRPNESRLRVDTPSMRGNYNFMQFSSKRSIRSMDHFAEIEEYFDGDPALMQAIGPRGVQRTVTNRMGDFNAILDFPPAPKLTPLMTLDSELATEQELRGEKIFNGKGQCIKCHYGPAFTDDYMHDLKVERFYHGRPEGPIKTFALRGIKDSPPYLHDGRCPTLHDTVEFFNIILQLKLTEHEKEDLVAYMLCL